MTSRPVFRHPIGPFERTVRRLYCEAMRRFGLVPFVMPAQGARFLVDPTDLIDRAIALDGMWEGAQLDDLARVCAGRRVDVFLDLGANSGFYSVLLARTGLVGEVIAFEPDPGNYARLIANLQLNRLQTQVKALPFALGDRAGDMTLMQAGADRESPTLN